MKMDLSIIVLSYKSKNDLARLLPSVLASQDVSFQNSDVKKFSAELIVVDNGSADGTFEWLQEWSGNFPNLNHKIIKNINNGFAAGNNLGIRHSTGQNILLLNPDTELKKNTLSEVLSFLQSDESIGICGCKVVKPNGQLDLACRRRFPNPWNAFQRLFLLSNKNYNKLDSNENETQEVDSVMGAFLLIRKSLVEKIGLLDEEFFMYGEDIDWCWRCKEAGYKVLYYPKVEIVHFKGSSSKKVPMRALKWFHDAMWIFYSKHYKNQYPFLLNALVWLGIKIRFYVLLAINFLKKDKIVSK